MSIKINTIVRWVFSAGLLVVVWFNTHWSVALSLTLVLIRLELDSRGLW